MFNGRENGVFSKDALPLEVEDFTLPEIVAAMRANKWLVKEGRLYAALSEDTDLYGALLVFRVETSWRAVPV